MKERQFLALLLSVGYNERYYCGKGLDCYNNLFVTLAASSSFGRCVLAITTIASVSILSFLYTTNIIGYLHLFGREKGTQLLLVRSRSWKLCSFFWVYHHFSSLLHIHREGEEDFATFEQINTAPLSSSEKKISFCCFFSGFGFGCGLGRIKWPPI